MIPATGIGLSVPAPLVYSGKVRDTYDLGNDRLLMVASDRISAFDVVLPSTIPGKGVVLTQFSHYWFEQIAPLVPNHLTGQTLADLGLGAELTASLGARSMIVRKAERIPIECVVRGYLAGSGWLEYQQTSSIAGHRLPAGLRLSDQLPDLIFTPARKNDVGHDENITVAHVRSEFGEELTDRLERLSLDLYCAAADQARNNGVIIADTKFEFGFIDGELTLIDEVLTPDSSRFWDVSMWTPGIESSSYDKQYLRNWLLQTDWNREVPGPELPAAIIEGTIDRYRQAFLQITGITLSQWITDHHLEDAY